MRLATVVLLLAFVALGACHKSKPHATPTKKSTAAPVPVRTGPPKQLPPMKIAAVDGKKYDLKPGNPMLLNLWATWCAPCRKEFPTIDAVYRSHKDEGLQVVAVAVSDDATKVKKFVAETGVTFDVALDTGDVAQTFGIDALPASYLVDRSGKIVWSHAGPLAEDDPAFLKAINTVTAKKKTQ